MKKIRVLIADDHLIVRKGLKEILSADPSIEVVGEAGNGIEAVQRALALHPDVVIMDVAMPKLNGIEATRRIIENQPQMKILVLTMHQGKAYVLEMIKAGAKGYLLKDAIESELIEAVKAIHRGELDLSPWVSRIIVEDYHKQKDSSDRAQALTPREREVLQLVAVGKSSKQIADQLGLSIYTVDTHRKHIMEKLDLHSTAELVSYAIRKGLVPE